MTDTGSTPDDDEWVADEAAEPDTDPADDATTDDQPGTEHEQLYTGVCHGGPWNAREAASRYPRGFLLIEPDTDTGWIYDYRDGAFHVRDEQPMDIHEDGDHNRWRAADEGDFDVRVTDDLAEVDA
jgi:hypothetical protein